MTILGREPLYQDEDWVSITYERVKAAALLADEITGDFPHKAKTAIVVGCALDVVINKRATTEKEANDLFAEDGSAELTSVALVWACVSLALDNS